ncbi:hypothetical protein ACFQQB_39145 [Nonomuraea rubra]
MLASVALVSVAVLTWFHAATTTRPMLTAKRVPTMPVTTPLLSR